jgi:chromosome segregation ATPase
MPTETERFLSAEEAVNSLLGDLERLKKEIESYGRARTALEDTRGQLRTTTERMAQLAEQSRGVIVAIGKVSTAEILTRVEGLRNQNAEHVQQVGQFAKQVKEAHTSLVAQSQKSDAEMTSKVAAAVEKTGLALAGLRETLTTSQKTITDGIRAASDQTAGAVADVRTSVERRLRKLTLLLVVGLPTTAIVAAVVTVLLLKFIR